MSDTDSEKTVFSFKVPTLPTGEQEFSVKPGETLYFVGANGSGKTRLAVGIEREPRQKTYRIAAHRVC